MQSNADVVLDVFRAVEQRDRDGLFAAYHDVVEFVEAPSLPYGGNFRGKDVLRQQLEATPERTWLGIWAPCNQPQASDGWTRVSSQQSATRSLSRTPSAP